MKRLFPVLVPPWREVWPSAVLGFLTVAGGVGLLGVGAWLLGLAGLRPATVLLLLVPITLVRAFSVLRAGSRYGERLASHRATLSHLARLKGRVFAVMATRTPPDLVKGASGDFLRRMTADVDRLQNLLVNAVTPPAVFFLVATVATIFLGSIAGWAAAAALAGGLLLAGVVLPVAGLAAAGKEGHLATQGARLAAGLVDAAQGMADLLMTPFGGSVRASLTGEATLLARRQRDLDRTGALVRGGALLLTNLTAFAVLVAAVPMVRHGRLAGVAVGAVVLGTIAAFEAAAPLVRALPSAAEDMASARRLLVPGGKPQPHDTAAPCGTAIALAGVGFSYGDGRFLMRGLDLEIPPGRHIALEGPSGEGKSTLLLLIAGLLAPGEGSLTVGGAPPSALPERVRARTIATVTQRPYLFPGTIAENIALGRPDAPRQDILAAARRAGLGVLIASLNKGLDTEVGEGGALFSYGERQRLAIARALLVDAPILLLDEAMTGLDDRTAAVVGMELAGLARGRTVVAVMHDRDPFLPIHEVWRLADGSLSKITSA